MKHLANLCTIIPLNKIRRMDVYTKMAERKAFGLGDVVEMKKQHPCGTNEMKIIRMGMDIRIKCVGCGHSVLIPRSRFEKKMKKVLRQAEE